MPESINIFVATNADVLSEPFLCYIPFGKRPDRYLFDKQQPLKHPADLREVTRVKFVSPHAESASKELKAMVNASAIARSAGCAIELCLGEEYFLELGFDRELKGQQIDFRTELPLKFCW